MKRIATAAAVGCLATCGLLTALAGASGAKTAHKAATLPTINVVMTGKTITVTGQTVSGAVNVVSTVSGEREGDPAFLRLNQGVTFAQAAHAVDSHNGDLNYLRDYGALIFDVSSPKGTRSAETVLQPGHYVALDTAPSQNSNSNVPATQLPHTEFDVSQSPHPAVLPPAEAKIRAIDFAFRGAKRLHHQEFVRFENDGFLVHMIIYAKGRNKAAAQKIARLLRAGKDNKIGPKLAAGFGTFAGPLSTGGVEQFNIRTGDGWYVLACFMDTQDGREHTRIGMVRLLRIAG